MNELMTLTEFAEEYKLQEEKASQLDMSSLSESDKKLLASYNENTEFLKKMENSLDFTQNSTAVISTHEKDSSGSVSLVTMTSLKDYASEMIVLTNNFDNDFRSLVQKNKDTFSMDEINRQTETVLSYKIVQDEIVKQQNVRNMQEITLREVLETLRIIEEEQARIKDEIDKKYEQEKKQQEQQKDNNPDYFEMLTKAAVTVIAVDGIKQIEDTLKENSDRNEQKAEQDKPIEVIEGNDGILNTSKAEEIAPTKMAAVQELINEKVQEVEKSFKTGDKGNREYSDKNIKIKKEIKEKMKTHRASRGQISR